VRVSAFLLTGQADSSLQNWPTSLCLRQRATQPGPFVRELWIPSARFRTVQVHCWRFSSLHSGCVFQGRRALYAIWQLQGCKVRLHFILFPSASKSFWAKSRRLTTLEADSPQSSSAPIHHNLRKLHIQLRLLSSRNRAFQLQARLFTGSVR
jgi:hypothetical protein